VLDDPASSAEGFLSSDRWFLQVSWRGLFGAKLACLKLDNSDLQDVFFPKTVSILTGQQCSWCSSFKHRCFYVERYLCFFNLAELAYVTENEPFFTLKTRIFRKQCYQKLTHFSISNTVLHFSFSNIQGFLQQIHVSLQLTWTGICGGNSAYFHLVSPKFFYVFFLKCKSVLTGKQCARCSCVLLRGFSL
jgi:hypothetical protein